MSCISEKNQYYEYGQLKTDEHTLKECPRAGCWDFTGCQFLVLIYLVLCIASFPLRVIPREFGTIERLNL